MGEYWNSGAYSEILPYDIDRNGQEELLVSGVNNEYRQGFVAVFDPLRLNGFSPQSKPEYT